VTLHRLLTAAAAFYLVFIARSLFTVDGALHSTLFDDAMISMRYARNFAEGAGLVWNPGLPPVQGYTNPAWTLVMAAVHVVIAPRLASLVMMGIGAGLLLVATAATYRAARLVTGSTETALAAATLTGGGYALVFWTLRGMEVGLLATLLIVATGAAIAYGREHRPRDAAIVLVMGVLAIWTRTDAVVPFAVIAAYVVIGARGRRVAIGASTGAALAIGLGVPLLFGLWVYDAALPNTYYLKLGGASAADRWARGLPAFVTFLLRGQAGALIPAVAVLIVAHRGWSRTRQELALIAAVALSVSAYSIHVGGDAWEWMGYANRYVAVGTPQIAILMAAGAFAFVRDPRAVRIGVPLMVALIAAHAGTVLYLLAVNRAFDVPTIYLYRENAGGVVTAVCAIAAALAALIVYVSRRRSFAGVCVMLWVFMNGVPAARWAIENGFIVGEDERAVRLGLLLRETVAPDGTIAISRAGCSPYFAERRAIDLLGKNDPVIARMPPAIPTFVPGHNKWDLRYSIGVLQPDLACDLPRRLGDTAYLGELGYRAIGGTCFFRPGARLDEPRLRAGIAILYP
jgi:hypothetical protein